VRRIEVGVAAHNVPGRISLGMLLTRPLRQPHRRVWAELERQRRLDGRNQSPKVIRGASKGDAVSISRTGKKGEGVARPDPTRGRSPDRPLFAELGALRRTSGLKKSGFRV